MSLIRDEASALTGYSLNPLDRLSEARDADCVRRALAQPQARLYLFAGEKPLLRLVAPPSGFDPIFAPAEAEALGMNAASAVLLGHLDGIPNLSAAVPESATGTRLKAIDLRTLAVEGLLAPEHLGPLAQAKSLHHWHGRHRFCANCGAPTEMACGGYRRDCRSCDAQHFPRTDPVVIMLAIDGDRCLLGRQARFLPGVYSCLAGFVEPGETIEDAVRREVREEAGLGIRRVRYHASQPWPFPSSLMIGCHCEAASFDIRLDREELEDGRWFTREEVRSMLARSHPQGLLTPPPIAIANTLIRAFAETGAGVLD
ncbi:MAG: NAD(+) diphosphatase [Pseudomonadota bacterium]|nr:NAD(+) diphosphatase [Pseudomonadota bacterium]